MLNQEIVDRAKYLLEAEIDGIADPTWSQTMFQIWGKDAQTDLVLKINNQILEPIFGKISLTITVAKIAGNPLDSDYIVNGLFSVMLNNQPCHITTVKKYLNNLLYTPSIQRPVAYIDNNKLFIQPADDKTSVTVRYLAMPDFDVSQQSLLPINWQHLIPLYIVARALEKDKQERSVNFMAQFNEGLIVINATLGNITLKK